jgi:hypothetical protein
MKAPVGPRPAPPGWLETYTLIRVCAQAQFPVVYCTDIYYPGVVVVCVCGGGGGLAITLLKDFSVTKSARLVAARLHFRQLHACA